MFGRGAGARAGDCVCAYEDFKNESKLPDYVDDFAASRRGRDVDGERVARDVDCNSRRVLTHSVPFDCGKFERDFERVLRDGGRLGAGNGSYSVRGGNYGDYGGGDFGLVEDEYL